MTHAAAQALIDPATVDAGDNTPFIRSKLQLAYEREWNDPGRVDALRLTGAYAFGDRKQYGLTATVPYLRSDADNRVFAGFGDVRFKAAWRFYSDERFAQAIAFAVQPRTATYQPQLGGAAMLLTPQYAFNAVLTDILTFTGQVTYVSGVYPRNRFVDVSTLVVEPMLTFVLPEDWFVTFNPKLIWSLAHENRPQHMLRYTFGKVFGANGEWSAAIYGQTALSEAAVQANYRQLIGASVTRFF
jgi:hypothetical protein